MQSEIWLPVLGMEDCGLLIYNGYGAIAQLGERYNGIVGYFQLNQCVRTVIHTPALHCFR